MCVFSILITVSDTIQTQRLAFNCCAHRRANQIPLFWVTNWLINNFSISMAVIGKLHTQGFCFERRHTFVVSLIATGCARACCCGNYLLMILRWTILRMIILSAQSLRKSDIFCFSWAFISCLAITFRWSHEALQRRSIWHRFSCSWSKSTWPEMCRYR